MTAIQAMLLWLLAMIHGGAPTQPAAPAATQAQAQAPAPPPPPPAQTTFEFSRSGQHISNGF